MPMNTIQIKLRRIKISLHSAGCSRTKRVMIWNMPKHDAITSMAQATHMENCVVRCSRLRKVCFIVVIVGFSIKKAR